MVPSPVSLNYKIPPGTIAGSRSRLGRELEKLLSVIIAGRCIRRAVCNKADERLYFGKQPGCLCGGSIVINLSRRAGST